MPHFTIDRFEADWVVLEDEQARTFRIPRMWVPPGAREGDVLNAEYQSPGNTAGLVRLEIDANAREQRLADAESRRASLPRGPKGDVSL